MLSEIMHRTLELIYSGARPLGRLTVRERSSLLTYSEVPVASSFSVNCIDPDHMVNQISMLYVQDF